MTNESQTNIQLRTDPSFDNILHSAKNIWFPNPAFPIESRLLPEPNRPFTYVGYQSVFIPATRNVIDLIFAVSQPLKIGSEIFDFRKYGRGKVMGVRKIRGGFIFLNVQYTRSEGTIDATVIVREKNFEKHWTNSLAAFIDPKSRDDLEIMEFEDQYELPDADAMHSFFATNDA
jgi:hypothetical protein